MGVPCLAEYLKTILRMSIFHLCHSVYDIEDGGRTCKCSVHCLVFQTTETMPVPMPIVAPKSDWPYPILFLFDSNSIVDGHPILVVVILLFHLDLDLVPFLLFDSIFKWWTALSKLVIGGLVL